MKCSKCQQHFTLSEQIEEKIALLGRDACSICCEQCKWCYICYRSTGDNLTRCLLCGYHYHAANAQNICKKCEKIEERLEYSALIGPEIPALERTIEDPDEALMKTIRDISKKIKPVQKSPEGIKNILLGDVEMAPLFSSPYPEEYACLSTLYICGTCLEYFSTDAQMKRHRRKCRIPYPPGALLYMDADGVCIFEVEGKERKTYCQSLCLLAKMFLNHKTLYYDVEPFLFYIVGQVDENGFVTQGYFSKEKEEGNNNLSCIVVFPPYRRLGLGSFLIDFSYYLTRLTESPPYTSGPEQPLSEEGEAAYVRYWADSFAKYVLARKQSMTTATDKYFSEISLGTGISVDSLKKGYAELTRAYKKPPQFADFLCHREVVKKTRRIIKQAVIKENLRLRSSYSQSPKEEASEDEKI